MWINKDGLLLSTKAMASKIRQVVLSIATMMALNYHVREQMRPVDLTNCVLSQGGSSSLSAIHRMHLKCNFIVSYLMGQFQLKHLPQSPESIAFC